MKNLLARAAIKEDGKLLRILTDDLEASAFEYGSRMSELFPAFIIEKIKDHKAVIAVTKNNIWVGYSFLKIEETGVTNAYRVYRVPSPVKEEIFELLKKIYPGQNL